MNLCALLCLLPAALLAGEPFGITLTDDATGRGVPLVELELVDGQRFVSDSAGRVAFDELGFMGQPVFFTVRGVGYEYKKDGFGFSGVKLTPQPGARAVVKLHRTAIAERLCRLTGRGIYRDSSLLGEKLPSNAPPAEGAARVVGQDSVQAVPYKDGLFWLWGDTMRAEYPLGNFRTSGARSDIPQHPEQGVDFRYFTDSSAFTRAMCPLPEKEGVVWMDGLAVVDRAFQNAKPTSSTAPCLIARYSRREGLGKQFAQGIAVLNDETAVFESAAVIPLTEKWRMIHGHVSPLRKAETDYLYFGEAVLNTRVPALLPTVLDPTAYEAWTCAAPDGTLRRKPNGALDYAWRKDAPPVDSAAEADWLKRGIIRAEECHFLPEDVDTKKRITLHGGTVRWNAHRQRWVLIAVQIGGGPSYLGEVWYSEATEPTGPWPRAVKIATHDHMSFYNPAHHDFLDRGSHIYFEGTYTRTFSGGERAATPLYEYNQLLYRLDLDNPRLAPVRN